MRISRKLSIYSGAIVLVTVLATAVATSLIIASQERSRNELRLHSASDRFERVFQQNAEDLARGWLEIAQDEALNTAILNSIQQNVLYLRALPELFLLDRTLKLERFAFYFPERFEGDHLLQVYADAQLSGVVRATAGKHFQHTRGEVSSSVQAIDDPGVFPTRFAGGPTYSLRSHNDHFLLVARYDYRNQVEFWAGGGGIEFERDRLIGHFVLERALGVDIATFEREAGTQISLYSREGHQVGGRTALPHLEELDPASGTDRASTLVGADGQHFDALVHALEFEGDLVGYFAVSISQRATDAQVSQALQSLLVVFLIVLVVILPTCFVLAGKFSQPIVELTEAASRIAGGELDHPIRRQGALEMRVLALNFEQMRDAVRAQIHDLSAEVDKRRAAEERLRRSEEDLAITLNSIGDAVIATDVGGCITRMNPVAEELLGESFDSCHGRLMSDVYQVVSTETGEPLPGPVELTLQAGKRAELKQDSLLETKAGRLIRVADSAAPIHNPRGQLIGAVLCFRDMSAHYELEQQLRQSQKMQAVGQLAGGIAHDFNNLLTAIIGYGELLMASAGSTGDGGQVESYASSILRASHRAAGLTSQLLSFSRKRPVKRELVSLHTVITDALKLLRVSLGPSIEVQCDLGEDLHALVDPTSIENSLINLGVNARDAIGDEGCLSIALRQVDLDSNFASKPPLVCKPGAFAEISIRDTGSGIDDGDMDRIFEPFFSTKDIGKGTGLGLAAVYGILQDHEGTVRVDSKLGQGTVFRLYLPLARGRKGVDQAHPGVRPGRGKLLVVDDEESLRSLLKVSLERLGYEVLLAHDGLAGVEVFAEQFRSVDLVLLDLMMPRMNGLEALQRMRGIAPDVKVLIASSFGSGEDAREIDDPGITHTVGKPFSIAELSIKIHELLNFHDDLRESV